MAMHFAKRTLKPHAEPVTANKLREGHVYFSVTYADDDMQIPIMETLVFVGANLYPGDRERVYFQDIGSHRNGVRYDSENPDVAARFFVCPKDKLKHFFEYEQALEELMRCSLRRSDQTQSQR